MKKEDLKIYQIYYLSSQTSDIGTGFEPYYNKEKSIFQENLCISNIRHTKNLDKASYVGVFSYKFSKKIHHNPSFSKIFSIIKENPSAEIFSPRPRSWFAVKHEKISRPIYFPEQQGTMATGKRFLSHLSQVGLISSDSVNSWTLPNKNNIYCNFWVGSKEFFLKYVDEFLDPVIDLIKSYPPDHNIFNETTYPTPKAWQNITGYKNYPLITFILERLINVYIIDRKSRHLALI